MLGVGCGARSYTTSLHYSREFAVGRDGVKSILQDYIHRSPASFDMIDYGCRLDSPEQRRRYIIKSILRFEGLDLAAYRARFSSDPIADLPDLHQLINEDFLVQAPDKLLPTQNGIDHSDLLGPRLFSADMQHAMQEFDLR
jgi:oxygen-independent coproporphyrinogen-3 oxidase